MKLIISILFICFCLSVNAEKKKIFVILGDNEYQTEETIPHYANQVFKDDFDLHYIYSDKEDRNYLKGLDQILSADLVILSVRRLALQKQQLNIIRNYIKSGKPILSIRTSTHGFSLRNNASGPQGSDQWPEFDKEILGCNYDGHYPNEDMTNVVIEYKNAKHPAVKSIKKFTCRSWLYKVTPLTKDSTVLLWGSTKENEKHPVAWVRTTEFKGNVFSTTLGHPEDFTKREFIQLLYNATYWLLNTKPKKPFPVYQHYGNFLEEQFPFFTSTLDSTKIGKYFPKDNLTARGIILKPGRDHYACFDTDLLKYSLFWKNGQISFNSMAPGSYNIQTANKKSSGGERALPVAKGDFIIGLGSVPGVETGKSTWIDPRAETLDKKQICNGPIPEENGRFNGVMLTEDGPVLSYSIDKTEIFEILKAVNFQNTSVIERRIQAVNAKKKIYFHIGQFKDCAISTNAEFVFIKPGNGRIIAIKAISENSFTFSNRGEKIDLEVDPSSEVNLSLFIWEGLEKDLQLFSSNKYKIMNLPDLNRTPPTYWPGMESTRALSQKKGDDDIKVTEIVLPSPNKQKRNIRASGIAFFKDGRAAVCTFDGDIWIVDGIDQKSDIKWKRFASGLYEPQGLVIRDEQIFVFDRTGLVRLHDRNGNGEADFYENFCNLPIQTGESREFPMDVCLLPDGSFVIAKGGQRGNTLNPHSGAVIKISPNGKSIEVIASGLREPYIGVDSKSGEIYASDQQGHYTPSTPFHVIKKDAFYGFRAPFDKRPVPEITEPTTWIPHRINQSGASILKVYSKQMAHFDNSLLYIDYNGPSLGRVYYNPERPNEAAYIRLKQDFTFPLLKGAVNPKDGLVYLSGFQVWDTKAPRISGICRIHPAKNPLTPTNVRYFKEGVMLSFATKINPDSVNPHMFKLERWNYIRTNKYGSGHYTLNGKAGQEDLAPSTATLSSDHKSIFIGVPGMKNVMQMALSWRLLSAKNQTMEHSVYFSINTLTDFRSLSDKFPAIDFDAPPIAMSQGKKVEPSIKLGEETVIKFGCIGCHSKTKETAGKSGPAWSGLFSSKRELIDGTTVIADEKYLNESILDPTAKAVKGFVPAMPSYRGIIKDYELESIVLYLKSLK
ncbi:MAG: ThuA domain-containing protein [Lentisphaeraceae bacterium]|nr:ThuA domain-containing protein [Lentisphaeraceae bacterium]